MRGGLIAIVSVWMIGCGGDDISTPRQREENKPLIFNKEESTQTPTETTPHNNSSDNSSDTAPADTAPTNPSPGSPEPVTPPPSEEPPPIRETAYCYRVNGVFSEKEHIERGETELFDWAEGGTCILFPIQHVWATFHNEELMKWSGTDKTEFFPKPSTPTTTHFYVVKYFVDNTWPLPNVEWTMEWYHSLQEGTFEAPQKILVNYAKVDGTSYIKYWEGSIILQKVTDAVTSFAMRNQLKATQQNSENAANTIRRIIGKLQVEPPNWEALKPKL